MDVLDRFEGYQIMCEVFYDHIPEDKRFLALAQAFERIQYEIKNVKKDKNDTGV